MSLKKLTIILILLTTSLFAQQPSYVITTNFVSPGGVGATNNLIGNGAAYHKLTWNVSGTVSACTIALDSSVDGNSWSAGGVIAGQTCTTNGTITSTSTIVNYVRLNMTSFTGTGSVFVIDQGYVNNPAGGGTTTVNAYLTSPMSQQTSATCTDITGMSFALAANKQYKLQCFIPITGSASATLQYCLNGPGTPTSYSINHLAKAATPVSGDSINQVAWGSKTSSTTIGAVTIGTTVTATIVNGSTASGTNLTVQTAANGTNGITVLADSSCSLTQLN